MSGVESGASGSERVIGFNLEVVAKGEGAVLRSEQIGSDTLFMAAVGEWLEPVQDLSWVYVQAWMDSDGVEESIVERREANGLGYYIDVCVPPPTEDSAPSLTSLVVVLQWERAMRQLGQSLGLTDPPRIPRTSGELDHLETPPQTEAREAVIPFLTEVERLEEVEEDEPLVPGWVRFLYVDDGDPDDRPFAGDRLIAVQRAQVPDGDDQFRAEVREWLKPAGGVWCVLVFLDPNVRTVERIVQERYPETGGMTYDVTLRLPRGPFQSAEEFRLMLVLQWERAMRHLALHLGLDEPPALRRTRREREWLETHPEPSIQDRSVRFRAAPVSGVGMTQLWGLLAPQDDGPTNLEGAGRRVAALSDDERGALALTVDKQLARWQAKASAHAGVACSTDSEEMHAMALLLGGRRTWNRALRSPEKYLDVFPVDPGDAELILDAVREV